MRVLIIGMNGQLGKALRRSFSLRGIPFVGVSSAVCDITDVAQVEAILDETQADCVVNAAAYTQVALAEKQPKLAYRVNAKGAENLAVACVERGSILVHISTDYVFDGKSRVPYTEEDPTGPLSAYGSSKLEGEKLVLANCPRSLVFRVSWLYDLQSPNFVNTMRKLMSERKEVQVVNDQVASPTSATLFADDIAQIITILNPETDQFGLFHYAHDGECSWYDFAQAIKSEFGLGAEVVAVKSDVFNDGVKRPNYSKLDTQRMYERFPISRIHWKDAFKQTKKQHDAE